MQLDEINWLVPSQVNRALFGRFVASDPEQTNKKIMESFLPFAEP